MKIINLLSSKEIENRLLGIELLLNCVEYNKIKRFRKGEWKSTNLNINQLINRIKYQVNLGNIYVLEYISDILAILKFHSINI